MKSKMAPGHIILLWRIMLKESKVRENRPACTQHGYINHMLVHFVITISASKFIDQLLIMSWFYTAYALYTDRCGALFYGRDS